MKYSRKQIDKAGRIISAKPVEAFEYAEAMAIVDDWRKLHLPVLETLMEQLKILLEKNEIKPAFSSQRLKRMISIQEKLQRTPNMGLGGVQDIGGVRFVFDDIPLLVKAKECISSASLDGFVLDHEVYDYVQKPKDSGYRSIHFVFNTTLQMKTKMECELNYRFAPNFNTTGQLLLKLQSLYLNLR